MADISPKVARTLARYLVVLVARLENDRGAVANAQCGLREAAWNAALSGLTDDERYELEWAARATAIALVVQPKSN